MVRGMRNALLFFLLWFVLISTFLAVQTVEVQFIVTSDSHYGITREGFRGRTNVSATIVNAALVQSMNRVPETTFPTDGGLRSGKPVGSIDFLVDTGDICNREEAAKGAAIQAASAS